jgi:quercetin dioxygenase-like cupin family protein
MRPVRLFLGVCAFLVCGSALAPSAPQAQSAKPTPLILEKDDGERRVWRPIKAAPNPALFILKVDPRDGGSSHLVFGTEDLPPGEKIETHRHPGADEILFLQNGTARVTLGESVKDAHGGATVFIPANTWISVSNVGSEAIHLVFIFSAPGFEEFMRAESVPEGQKVLPLSPSEDAQIMAKHSHAVIYKQP